MKKKTDNSRVLLLIALYGLGLLKGFILGYSPKPDHAPLEPSAPAIQNPVSHGDDVKFQDVQTTFHDYKVVTRNGIVPENGVIHKANCKCKIKKAES